VAEKGNERKRKHDLAVASSRLGNGGRNDGGDEDRNGGVGEGGRASGRRVTLRPLSRCPGGG